MSKKVWIKEVIFLNTKFSYLETEEEIMEKILLLISKTDFLKSAFEFIELNK